MADHLADSEREEERAKGIASANGLRGGDELELAVYAGDRQWGRLAVESLASPVQGGGVVPQAGSEVDPTDSVERVGKVERDEVGVGLRKGLAERPLDGADNGFNAAGFDTTLGAHAELTGQEEVGLEVVPEENLGAEPVEELASPTAIGRTPPSVLARLWAGGRVHVWYVIAGVC